MIIARVFVSIYSSFYLGPARILDYVPTKGNPRFFQCMLDEDLIRRATRFEFSMFWKLWQILYVYVVDRKSFQQMEHPTVCV